MDNKGDLEPIRIQQQQAFLSMDMHVHFSSGSYKRAESLSLNYQQSERLASCSGATFCLQQLCTNSQGAAGTKCDSMRCAYSQSANLGCAGKPRPRNPCSLKRQCQFGLADDWPPEHDTAYLSGERSAGMKAAAVFRSCLTAEQQEVKKHHGAG